MKSEMVDQLVGWSTKTVGQGYGGGFFYSQFKERLSLGSILTPKRLSHPSTSRAKN